MAPSPTLMDRQLTSRQLALGKNVVGKQDARAETAAEEMLGYSVDTCRCVCVLCAMSSMPLCYVCSKAVLLRGDVYSAMTFTAEP